MVLLGVAFAIWLSAGASVLAAATTAVLAVVAVIQMRGARAQIDAAIKQAKATADLAQSAQQDRLQRVMAIPMSQLPYSPEQRAAGALERIAAALAQAYPPPQDGQEGPEEPPDKE